jgi:hypothetical protein
MLKTSVTRQKSYRGAVVEREVARAHEFARARLDVVERPSGRRMPDGDDPLFVPAFADFGEGSANLLHDPLVALSARERRRDAPQPLGIDALDRRAVQLAVVEMETGKMS